MKLTKREKEVLTKVLEGKANKKIADELHVSIHTVKTHVSNILRKKDVKTRIDLIVKFRLK